MNEKVVDKIKKLLALATSSNENEAQLAAERANELLVKYNLSMQEVRQKVGEGDWDGDYEKRTIETVSRATPDTKWIMVILNKHFFVHCIRARSGEMKLTAWVIVGERTNTEIAHYVHGFLKKSFKSLWISYKKDNGLSESSRQSYYYGLFKGLDEQLGARRKFVEGEKGLVVVPDPNLPLKVQELVGKTFQSGIRATLTDVQAQDDGIEAGRRLQIKRGIESYGTDTQFALE